VGRPHDWLINYMRTAWRGPSPLAAAVRYTTHRGEGARLCSEPHDNHYHPSTVALPRWLPLPTGLSPSSRTSDITGEFLGRVGTSDVAGPVSPLATSGDQGPSGGCRPAEAAKPKCAWSRH